MGTRLKSENHFPDAHPAALSVVMRMTFGPDQMLLWPSTIELPDPDNAGNAGCDGTHSQSGSLGKKSLSNGLLARRRRRDRKDTCSHGTESAEATASKSLQ